MTVLWRGARARGAGVLALTLIVGVALPAQAAANADTPPATLGSLAGAAVALDPVAGGTIEGTVTLTPAAADMGGGCVEIVDSSGSVVASQCPDSSGSFSIFVAPGDYSVHFSGFTNAAGGWNYSSAWYPDMPTQGQSTALTVGTGTASTANATLARAGSRSGTVSVPAGASLDGWVGVVDASDGSLDYWMDVDSSGHYAFDDVIQKDYKFAFFDFTGAADGWWTSSYGWPTGGAPVYELATPWWVGPGQTVDMALNADGVIAGVFHAPGAADGSPVCVQSYYNFYISGINHGYGDRWTCGLAGHPFVIDHLQRAYHTLLFVAGSHWEGDWYYYPFTQVWESSHALWTEPGTATYVAVFPDVLWDDPFTSEIGWMAFAGISTGFPDGTFHPAANVTRQAMAAFMYRFAGSPAFTPPVTSPFNDVPTDSPFYKEITWMADQGISTGYGDGGFHPAASVSRQAMAAFMYRIAGSPAFTPPATSPFLDVAPGGSFYAEVTWMADQGISMGYGDGGFHPAADVSRQAMAAFMFRLASALASPPSSPSPADMTPSSLAPARGAGSDRPSEAGTSGHGDAYSRAG